MNNVDWTPNKQKTVRARWRVMFSNTLALLYAFVVFSDSMQGGSPEVATNQRGQNTAVYIHAVYKHLKILFWFFETIIESIFIPQ